MQLPPERPLSLAAAFAFIRAVTLLVPPAEQGGFQIEWEQKLFHRWQFLRQAGFWNANESLRLLAGAAPALPDAVQHFGAQPLVRSRVSRFIQSPATALSALLVLLIFVAVLSHGFPATRDLFFKRLDGPGSKLVYIWSHNLRGGGDRPLPTEVINAWKTHSRLITSAAAFRAVHRDVELQNSSTQRHLVIFTEPAFFTVMATQPVTGPVSQQAEAYALLSYRIWIDQFHASPRITAAHVTVAGFRYPILGVLPAGFAPLSRQPAIYLVDRHLAQKDAFAAMQVRTGVSQDALDREFTQIAQDVTFYFLAGQLRFGFAQATLWDPVRSFACGLVAAALMLLLVFRVKWRWPVPEPPQRRAFARGFGFFLLKAALGLAIVFMACLEWSRSPSAILFGNFDPATGPFLLWLYILGAMGVLFWAVIDQKARCRECLQLLAFPVRMGSPGSLLLDWSGIELCCSKGHGVLHVPHLAPSWAEESEQWIALDDSWQSIFRSDK